MCGWCGEVSWKIRAREVEITTAKPLSPNRCFVPPSQEAAETTVVSLSRFIEPADVLMSRHFLVGIVRQGAGLRIDNNPHLNIEAHICRRAYTLARAHTSYKLAFTLDR